MKPAENLNRLGAQLSGETVSRTQVYDWNMSFKEGRTEVENMPRLHLMKGKLRPAFFRALKASYSSSFSFSARTTNRHQSLLLEAS